jgi:diaminopimelate epimerase
MKISFTKMHGAGNDFVVLDETGTSPGLTRAQYRFLADRHFGVGADQILTVRPAPGPDVDFEYVIHNADGGEVEHCGNGARCFVRFVREHGLTQKSVVRVKVKKGVLELRMGADGRVTVDMGAPVFALTEVPFDSAGLLPVAINSWEKWPLALYNKEKNASVFVSVLSMGNPHAVLLVDDVDAAPVAEWGPLVQRHNAFPNGVNVGFLQVVDRRRVRLRVYERGAGETLACGTGACAAVVAGVRLGLLDGPVDVQALGGTLTIDWQLTPALDAPVFMSGPAITVFKGEIDLPGT